MHWCDPDLFRCVCRAGPTGRASSTLMACLRFEDAANAFQLIVVLFFTSLICLRECGAGGDGPLRSKTQPSFPSFCRRVAGCTGPLSWRPWPLLPVASKKSKPVCRHNRGTDMGKDEER
jgi:hypothetical protein